MARKHRSKPRPHRRPVPQNAKPVALQRWRERIDKPLEILICVGHIAAVVGLLVEHLS
jgi:hypothetical protein